MSPSNAKRADHILYEAYMKEGATLRELEYAERKAYHIRYGWILPGESSNSIGHYNRAKREHDHMWSAQSVGEMFGLREYGKLIPLKDYLELPANIAEDILEGVSVGERKAKEAADRARASQQGKGNSAEDLLNAVIDKEGRK